MNRAVVVTYLEALIQSVEKKATIIDKLIDLSREQEKLTKNSEFNLDEFNEYVEKKEGYIRELSTIDNGFGQTFDRIKDTLKINKEQYREEIQRLQNMISAVTTHAVELQCLEVRIKACVEKRMIQEKKKINSVVVNNQVAASYYRNMANRHYDQSYFLDQKR